MERIRQFWNKDGDVCDNCGKLIEFEEICYWKANEEFPTVICKDCYKNLDYHFYFLDILDIS